MEIPYTVARTDKAQIVSIRLTGVKLSQTFASKPIEVTIPARAITLETSPTLETAMISSIDDSITSVVNNFEDETIVQNSFEKFPAFSIDFDTACHALFIRAYETTDDDVYAFVQVWKLNSDGSFKSAVNTYSLALKTDELGRKYVNMDLSFLKVTTKWGLKIFSDKATTPLELIINEQPPKLSLKYNAVKGIFTGKIGSTVIPETGLEIGEDKYWYRGQYASLTSPLFLEDFEMYSHIAGATILVRQKATIDTLAGTEVKVKIAAAPKAPKVSIDYVKGIISFPKNVEYYVDGEFIAIMETAGKAWKATLDDLVKYGVPTEGGVTLLVRTAATETKMASNVTLVTIPGVEAAELSEGYTETKGTIKVSGSEATATYQIAGSATKPTYQFTANGASFDFSVNGGDTWKTVKSGKSYTVTLTNSDQNILVRLTGVKADATFASKPAEVTVPAKGFSEVTPTPDDEDDSSTGYSGRDN